MLFFKQPVKREEFTSEDIMRYHSEFVPGDDFLGGKAFSGQLGRSREAKLGYMGTLYPQARRGGRLFTRR